MYLKEGHQGFLSKGGRRVTKEREILSESASRFEVWLKAEKYCLNLISVCTTNCTRNEEKNKVDFPFRTASTIVFIPTQL